MHFSFLIALAVDIKVVIIIYLIEFLVSYWSIRFICVSFLTAVSIINTSKQTYSL